MTDAKKPADHSPGYSRDKDLEARRGTGRPAEANLNAFDRRADEKPDTWVHISPEPRR